MKNIHSWNMYWKALEQCRETIKAFQGSNEMLQHIQRVDEALRMLVATTN